MKICITTSGYEKERETAWLKLFGDLTRGLGLESKISIGLQQAEPDAEIAIIPAGGMPSASIDQSHVCRLTLLVRHAPCTTTSVQFERHPDVPFPFLGRCVTTRSLAAGHQVPDGFRAVATVGGTSLWSKSGSQGKHDAICSVSDPVHILNRPIHGNLSGFCFLNLLPIVDWLREIGRNGDVLPPVLRACFMFDDPNLHASTYGYVDYQEIASSAERNRYHVAFATCPIDTVYHSSAAVRICSENRRFLSFLVHGNNHTRRELADRTMRGEAQYSLMRQAYDRISRLQCETGLSVDKIMAPPHGVCSDQMIKAMQQAGFHAVCVSHGSLAAGTPPGEWSSILGLQPANTAFGHFQIPRFPLCADSTGFVLLAAYLNQAIILVGHHWDLRQGLQLLEENARLVNSLGAVEWAPVSELRRFAYSGVVNGASLECGVYSDEITVTIPRGVTSLVLRHAIAGWRTVNIACNGTAVLPAQIVETGAGECHVSVVPGDVMTVAFKGPEGEAISYLPPSTPFSAILRRVLVLLRDHLMPIYRPRLP